MCTRQVSWNRCQGSFSYPRTFGMLKDLASYILLSINHPCDVINPIKNILEVPCWTTYSQFIKLITTVHFCNSCNTEQSLLKIRLFWMLKKDTIKGWYIFIQKYTKRCIASRYKKYNMIQTHWLLIPLKPTWETIPNGKNSKNIIIILKY